MKHVGLLLALALAGCDGAAEPATEGRTIRLSAAESLTIVDLPVPAVAEQYAEVVRERCMVYRHDGWQAVQMQCGPVLRRSGQ